MVVPQVQTLVTSIEEDELDPIGQLRAAAVLGSELSSVSDEVVNHFVEKAREEGHSWTEIGDVLGMTKQAAQQRFRLRWFDRLVGGRSVPWMRYTDRARRVVRNAVGEALSLNHNYVGTEHFLLAILREKNSVGERALRDLGLTASNVRQSLEQKAPPADASASGNLSCTPLAKHALRGARHEAKTLGHNYVGTEHLLLSLTRVKKGLAAEILRERGVTLPDTRRSVISLLTHHSF